MLRCVNCHDLADCLFSSSRNVVDGIKKETGVVDALPMK